MRRILILFALLLLVGLAGCGGTTVEPGDGPAATADPADPGGPSVAEGEGHPPIEGEPGEEPPTEAPQKIASFKEKYVYDDGLEVEVIKIVNGKFTPKDVEYTEEAKAGDPYTKLTMRVRNGSKVTIQLLGSATVTYGPDGTEAVLSSLLDTDSMDGKLIPGKSRSAAAVYLIPPKYYGDVVMEFSPDLEHSSAVFSGSIK